MKKGSNFKPKRTVHLLLWGYKEDLAFEIDLASV